jgi:hypothetical protein
MGRLIGGIVAGIVVFVIALLAFEFLAHQIFQVSPKGAIPNAMHAFVAIAYFLASLAGGLVASRVSGRPWTAWVIAILVAAGAAYTLTNFTHPLWMQVASIVAPLAGGLAARRLARPGPVPDVDAR